MGNQESKDEYMGGCNCSSSSSSNTSFCGNCYNSTATPTTTLAETCHGISFSLDAKSSASDIIRFVIIIDVKIIIVVVYYY